MTRKRPHERRGTVVVTTAVCLTMLMAVIALSLDGGILLDQRRQIQGACDAAALAAVDQLYADYLKTTGGVGSGLEPSKNGPAHTSATDMATANGYTDDGGVTTTVTVDIPPTSGPFVGKAGYAEVNIAYNQPRYFSTILGTDTIPVGARAVARGIRDYSGNSVIVLDPSTTQATTTIGGGGTIQIKRSPIQVNGQYANGAVTIGGTGSVTIDSGINVVAGSPGYSKNSNSTLVGTISPNQPAIADPLRFLPVPDPLSLPSRTGLGKITGSNAVTLQPGVYDGISITSANANVTFAPGIYYIKGGGFNITGGMAQGDGVFFYNDPSSNSDQVNIASTVRFTPPTTGPYQGVLLFQSRSTVNTPPVSIQGSSTSTLDLTGTFYVPTALLSVTGNGNQTVKSQFISYDLKIGGTGNLVIDYDPTASPPLRLLTLVE